MYFATRCLEIPGKVPATTQRSHQRPCDNIVSPRLGRFRGNILLLGLQYSRQRLSSRRERQSGHIKPRSTATGAAETARSTVRYGFLGAWAVYHPGGHGREKFSSPLDELHLFASHEHGGLAWNSNFKKILEFLGDDFVNQPSKYGDENHRAFRTGKFETFPVRYW
jgi:hypothetical protein